MKGILSYHQIRYALVGAEPHPILTKQQPEELYTLGVKIDYRSGVHNPKFEYDPHVMYAHMTRKKESMDAPVTKPEAKSETTAPAESVTNEVTPEVKVEECNLKHVPRWVQTLLLRGINESRVTLDDNKVMRIDGFPIIGIKYVTADMIEGDIPDDWKPITYDNDDLVSKDTSTK
jgi:hypothetical protein